MATSFGPVSDFNPAHYIPIWGNGIGTGPGQERWRASSLVSAENYRKSGGTVLDFATYISDNGLEGLDSYFLLAVRFLDAEGRQIIPPPPEKRRRRVRRRSAESWDRLSATKRQRYLGAGITREDYMNGVPLERARGQRATPEHPERALKYPARFPLYLARNQEKLRARFGDDAVERAIGSLGEAYLFARSGDPSSRNA